MEVIPLASEEQVGNELSDEDKTAVAAHASVAFDIAMRTVVRAVVVWLVCVFFLLASALGLIYAKADSIDTTVTSHNTELTQTLTAACVLIKSDPKLPLPAGCITALKSVNSANH